MCTQLFACIDITYTLSVFLVKLSILLLYQRIFGVYGMLKRLITCGYAVITFTMMGTLANSIARLELCAGEQAMQNRLCFGVNFNICVLTSATLNTFTDFYILAIPVGRVLKIQVTTRKRINLLIIFLAGLV